VQPSLASDTQYQILLFLHLLPEGLHTNPVHSHGNNLHKGGRFCIVKHIIITDIPYAYNKLYAVYLQFILLTPRNEFPQKLLMLSGGTILNAIHTICQITLD
jgi:hypothetical protein